MSDGQNDHRSESDYRTKASQWGNKEGWDTYELNLDEALVRRINELQKQEATTGLNYIESQELSNNRSVLGKRKNAREYEDINIVSSSQLASFSTPTASEVNFNTGLHIDAENCDVPIKVGERDIVAEIDELKKVKNGDLLEAEKINDIISAINVLSEKVDKKESKKDSEYGAMLKSIKNTCPTCGAELKLREMDTHKLLECEYCSKESIVVFGVD